MNDWTQPYRVAFLIFVFGALIVSLMGCATVPANVVRSYANDSGDVLVLSDSPCITMAGVFAMVPVDKRKAELKSAKMIWQGKSYEACWIKENGLTIVVDETGEVGAVEGSPFDPALQKGAGA